MIKKQITAKTAGQPIRSYVQTEVGLSQRLLKKLKAIDGGIQVNGVEKTVRYILQTDDILCLRLPESRNQTSIIPEEVPFKIHYEDDDVMVIEKPAGIATIPSRDHPSGTVANGIIFYYDKISHPHTVHVVTRLDRDTSGLLLIAKHPHAHSLLSRQLQKGKIERKYLAIVHGRLAQENGTINAAIGRKADSLIERIVREDGQRAVTHYEVIEECGDFSLVHIQLETGRTHQIRVHFAYLGHPLVGDNLYGGNVEMLSRQALHASALSFQHPTKGEDMEFHVKLPTDLEKICRDFDLSH